MASPPAVTEGLFVIYGDLGECFMRNCDLLPVFKVTGCKPFLELARSLSCASTGRTRSGKTEALVVVSATGILAAPDEQMEGVSLQDYF